MLHIIIMFKPSYINFIWFIIILYNMVFTYHIIVIVVLFCCGECYDLDLDRP